MHRLLLLLALVGSCKRDNPSGLPPSNDWGSAEADPGAKPPMAKTNPNPGGGGADPHAGVPGAPPLNGGGAVDSSDPHAGVPGAPPINGGGADPQAGSMQPNTVPQPVDAKSLEKTADGRSVLGPFTLAPPKEWNEKPITSSMRAAQFTWSEKSGEQAELIVYYFGEGGAGGVEANLERWLALYGVAFQPIEGASTGKPLRKIDSSADHRGNVLIVFGLDPLQDHVQLGGHQIIERRNLQHPISRQLRLTHPPKRQRAKERDLHPLIVRGARKGEGRQSIGGVLKDCGSMKKRKGFRQCGPIQRLVREKIEIDRSTVPESQRNRRPAVEHKPHPRC